MAFIAEPLSALVTFPAVFQLYFRLFCFVYDFVPDLFQKNPVIMAHILQIPDAWLTIGFFEERLSARRNGKSNDTVPDREKYDQYGNHHDNNFCFVV